jgi:hypothetical protein
VQVELILCNRSAAGGAPAGQGPEKAAVCFCAGRARLGEVVARGSPTDRTPVEEVFMPKNSLWSELPILVVAFSLLTTAACGTVQAPVTPAKSDATSRVQVSEAYGKLPLYFEANQGQTDEQVKFLARGGGNTLFLTPSEAVVVLTKREQPARGGFPGARLRPAQGRSATRTVLRMTFVGANPEPRLMGTEELAGKANYFIGNDPATWRTNVPTYAKVHYQGLYPGIDLIYYGNGHQLEYDFVVGSGADPDRILLDVQGAHKLELDAQGDLVLHTAAGVIRQRKPVIYQEVDGARREVAGGYVLKGAHRVGFHVAAYDTTRPLVIDPVLFYSTYLGGSADDFAVGIAVDVSGNAYVTGATFSTNFPTTPGSFQLAPAGDFDVFVTKLNPTGSALLYSTYLGGNGQDQGNRIAVDVAGNAFVVGFTRSTNLPTTVGAFQAATGGGFDTFVSKLNPTGSALIYSTYLGGSGEDDGFGVALDAAGNAYVSGGTTSNNFPTTAGAFQTTLAGSFDAFATKLSPTGATLGYSTYLGGGGFDSASGIAVDTSGGAYVVGSTTSVNFPTTSGAFQTAFGGGPFDAFVVRIDPLGSILVYSTYLGGSGDDSGFDIALDNSGNAHVTGPTTSTNFPTTPGAFQATLGGVGPSGFGDAYVTKLNATGGALLYSTYLGGNGDDFGGSLALDAAGNAYVTGVTASSNFSTTPGAFQAALAGGFDAFVTKLNPTGSALVYSSYLGGGGDDVGLGVAVDALPNPNAYVVGDTTSANFPTTAGAFQSAFAGGGPFFFDDAVVAKIADVPAPQGPFTARVTGGGTIDVPGGIGTFSFIIQRASTGELSGRLQYVNHASGAQVQSVTYTSLVIVGTTATFDGTCTVDGTSCTFTVNVADNGEPGTSDTFTISVSGGPTEGGILRSGNILIIQ